ISCKQNIPAQMILFCLCRRVLLRTACNKHLPRFFLQGHLLQNLPGCLRNPFFLRDTSFRLLAVLQSIAILRPLAVLRLFAVLLFFVLLFSRPSLFLSSRSPCLRQKPKCHSSCAEKKEQKEQHWRRRQTLFLSAPPAASPLCRHAALPPAFLSLPAC